jgi:hypothetical protein
VFLSILSKEAIKLRAFWLAGLTAHLGATLVLLEPKWRLRAFNFAMAAGLTGLFLYQTIPGSYAGILSPLVLLVLAFTPSVLIPAYRFRYRRDRAMILIARYALVLPALLVLAVYVPMLFDLSFDARIKKTHMFYSPVINKFIWRDKVLDPAEKGLGEVHHAQFVQQDQDGRRYTWREFEKLLLFIYYKNMEIWGLLPLRLHGKSFDKKEIRADRQVVELNPRQIAGRSPQDDIYPLIEAKPGSVRLVFPEDRFRLDDEMEFINADLNHQDSDLSRAYTSALEKAGFKFPARLAAGKNTILKPFEGSFFLVDDNGAAFHLKRLDGKPWVVKNPIDPGLGIRSIKVAENKRREFHGLLLTRDGRLFLISYDNNQLIPLPLEGYDPDAMDFKLIINPLFRTATYSDDKVIKAVVMDGDYQLIDRYERTKPGAGLTPAQRVFSYLMPFRVSLEDSTTGYLSLDVKWHGWLSLIMAGLALVIILLAGRRRGGKAGALLADGPVVLPTGLYGLAVLLILPYET